MGTGGGSTCGCESRNARAKEEDENGKCGGAVIKHFPHLFAFEGFWETVTAIHASPNSPQLKVGRYLGLHVALTHITDFSPQFVMAHRIFTDISDNHHGSVITTVQPLLWCFLHDSVFSKLIHVFDPVTM